jgi:hypothetical protein
MAKWRSLPVASTTQQGVVQAGHGIQVPSTGTFAQAVATAQLWVDPNGNDTTGDGSFGNPWLTLSHTFTYIVANPLSNGYIVHLPPGSWEEAVPLPPSGTVLKGSDVAQSSLAGVSDVPLVWTQSVGDVRALTFRDLVLSADITGGNASGSSLALTFQRCSLSTSELTNVGSVLIDDCNPLPTFTNCGSVTIQNCAGYAAGLNLAYDPLTATNGSFSPGLLLLGGQWGTVSYTVTESGANLEIIGARAQNVQGTGPATIQCRNTRVLGQLNAGVGCVIEYDMPSVNNTPTFAGSGSFKMAEYIILKTISPGFTAGPVTVPIPTDAFGGNLTDVIGSSDLPGTIVTYVSNTTTTLTVFVDPGTSPTSSALHLVLLVKP